MAATLLVACSDDDVGPPDATQAASEDACNSPPVRGFGFDRYGGWKGIERAVTGRFRVEPVEAVWWLITPDGHALFSNGPTGVDAIGDTVGSTNRSPYNDAILKKYGSLEAWAANTKRRFCTLGIRSLGGWMSAADLDRFGDQVPYTVNVDFYETLPRVRGGASTLKARHDVFDPRAEELVRSVAGDGSLLQRCARDPWCIGAYTENEVAYLPSLLSGGGHLDSYVAQAAGTPVKLALQQFFVVRYAGDVEAFNRTWGTQLTSFDDIQQLHGLGTCPTTIGFDDDLCYFAEPRTRLDDRFAFEAYVAARIAQLGADVIHGLHPGMLDLGPRLVIAPFAPIVLQALAGPADVISINNYDTTALADALTAAQRATLAELNLLSFEPIERLRQLGAITGKPVLITEWFYRRARVGVATYPPIVLPEVADGAAQAAAYRRYMDSVLALPFVVGEHWFQWPDQPVEGRFDGENQLIGIVDINDELNQPLADTMAAVNASIIERRLRLRR